VSGEPARISDKGTGSARICPDQRRRRSDLMRWWRQEAKSSPSCSTCGGVATNQRQATMIRGGRRKSGGAEAALEIRRRRLRRAEARTRTKAEMLETSGDGEGKLIRRCCSEGGLWRSAGLGSGGGAPIWYRRSPAVPAVPTRCLEISAKAGFRHWILMKIQCDEVRGADFRRN